MPKTQVDYFFFPLFVITKQGKIILTFTRRIDVYKWKYILVYPYIVIWYPT